MRLHRWPAAPAFIVSCLAACAPAALAQQPVVDPAAAEIEVPTAPVTLDGKVLFELRGVSAIPAETRASLVAGRIRDLARDPAIATSTLRAETALEWVEIKAGDRLLLRLFEADAKVEGVPLQTLALVDTQVIAAAIEAYRAARTPEALAAATSRALVATALLLLFALLGRRLFRRLGDALLRRHEQRIALLEARSHDILRAERVRQYAQRLFRAARALALLGAAYVWLGYTLGLFPSTRPTSERLTELLVAPLRSMASALIADIPDLLFLVMLTVVVRVALRLLRLAFDGVGAGRIQIEGFDPEWSEPTYKIARAAVVAFALVVAYPYIPGSGSDAFKGVSLFAGVVFSLGSTSIIANTIAGYSMTYRRAFKLGDRVKIGSVVGDVTAIRLQVTHLRTPKNEEVVVPNSTILNTDVTNYSALARTQGLILHTTVGIGYEVPWRQVEAMLLLAAERTHGLEKEPPPFVLQKALGDFAITYEINVYCRDPQAMGLFYSDLHRNIQDVFNEHGVQIMTPAYERDPAQPKLVPKDQWFAAPAKPPSA